MSPIVPTAFLLILLILLAGFVAARRGRRKLMRGIGLVTAYCRRQGWQQAPPDRDINARTLLLFQATGTTRLRVQAQYAGRYRSVSFQAAQVARPPRPGRVTAQWVSVVHLPRPVPGPRVQLAKRGLSSANFLSGRTTIDNGPFDATFHVVAEDEAFARSVLRPSLAGALCGDARALDGVVAFEHHHLFALRHGQLTPEKLRAMLDLLVDIGSSVDWQAATAPRPS
ncbi:hypothetical protein ACFUCH_04410 [Streptomyces olivaceus]|uniref:hypothetical protein n=1 Tax=Streptomyces olivaceus TaxID=47716 RepID=UPI003635C800